MRIKKAVYHETFIDSPRFREKLKNELSIKQKTIQRHDKQLPQLKQSTPNTKINLQSLQNKNKNSSGAAQLLARLLKKSITQSCNKDSQKMKFYKSSVFTPQQFVNGHMQGRLCKNKSDMMVDKKINKKLLLQKIRTQNQSISSIRYKSCEKDEQYNFKNENSLSNASIQQKYAVNLKEQNRQKIKFIQNNDKRQTKSFLTLSSIKQRIQNYLVKEEQKMKQLKHSNLYSNNPKAIRNYMKNQISKSEEKTAQSQNFDKFYYKSNENSNNRIIASLSSLIRKKQSKHAFDMMKRRLNFSMISKSPKQRDNLYLNENSTSLDRKTDHYRIQENYKRLVIDSQINNEEAFRQMTLESQFIKSLQNNPELLQQVERQLLCNLQNFNKNNFKILIKKPSLNQLPQGTHRLSNTQNFTCSINKNISGQPNQNLQYPYTLYYYPTSEIENSITVKQQKKQINESQTQSVIKVEIQKYKNWKKQTKTQQKLKNLQKHQINPIDPLQFYHNSFMTNSNINSINSLISGKKNKIPSYLSSQNSSSSLFHTKNKYKFYGTDQTQQKTPKILQQKIIFVNKKHKQNLQHKKLSNLLSKIQRRNSQIQRLGQIEVVEIFRNQKSNKGNKYIKKLNKRSSFDQYIEDQNPMTVSSPLEQVRKSHNFIISPPKKMKQLQKSLQKNVHKNNSDDWTNFQPWPNSTNKWGFQQQNYQKLMNPSIKIG